MPLIPKLSYFIRFLDISQTAFGRTSDLFYSVSFSTFKNKKNSFAVKIVQEYDSLFEAQVVKQRLESERIPAVVLNENTRDYVPFAAAIPSLQAQVAVDDADYERACALLFGKKTDENRIVCPQCGSENVRSVLGRNRLQRVGIYALCILNLFANNSPGQIHRYFRCGNCGAEFH